MKENIGEDGHLNIKMVVSLKIDSMQVSFLSEHHEKCAPYKHIPHAKQKGMETDSVPETKHVCSNCSGDVGAVIVETCTSTCHV